MNWIQNWPSYILRINIGVSFFKPVYIIGWCTDTEYFINGNIFILGWITDIQNPCSESMHSRIRNVRSEGVKLCHWTVELIKFNTLTLRTNFCTVGCKKITCIRTVTFLNICINEWEEELFHIREVFYWYGRGKKAELFFFLLYCKNKSSFQNFLQLSFKSSPMFFGVRCFYGRQNSRCETIGMTWSNL